MCSSSKQEGQHKADKKRQQKAAHQRSAVHLPRRVFNSHFFFPTERKHFSTLDIPGWLLVHIVLVLSFAEDSMRRGVALHRLTFVWRVFSSKHCTVPLSKVPHHMQLYLSCAISVVHKNGTTTCAVLYRVQPYTFPFRQVAKVCFMVRAENVVCWRDAVQSLKVHVVYSPSFSCSLFHQWGFLVEDGVLQVECARWPVASLWNLLRCL